MAETTRADRFFLVKHCISRHQCLHPRQCNMAEQPRGTFYRPTNNVFCAKFAPPPILLKQPERTFFDVHCISRHVHNPRQHSGNNHGKLFFPAHANTVFHAISALALANIAETTRAKLFSIHIARKTFKRSIDLQLPYLF